MSSCYSSIDTLPAYHWYQIQKTGNLAWLYMDQPGTPLAISRKEPQGLEKIALAGNWRRILAEYIDTFGFSKSYQQALELRRQIALMTCKMLATNNSSLQLLIEVKKAKLEKMVASETGTNDLDEVSILVKKYMGYDVNTRQISIREFRTIVNNIYKQWQNQKTR